MGGRPKKMKPGVLEKAKALRAEGLSWDAIGKKLDLYPSSLRERLCPEYKARKKEERRQRWEREKHKIASTRYVRPKNEPPVPKIPRIQDTRDLTGVMCGDPLPERSALAQRRAEDGRRTVVVSLYRLGSSDSHGGVSSGA